MLVKDPLFILYVHDMDRALKLYRDTFDFEAVQRMPVWSMLRCRGANIALQLLSKDSTKSVALHAGHYLHAEDLDAGIIAVCEAGGEHIVTRKATDVIPVRKCELRDNERNGFELRQLVSQGKDFSAIA